MANVNTVLGLNQSQRKTIAMLKSDGSIDVTTQTDRPYFQTGTQVGKISMHNAVTIDGTSVSDAAPPPGPLLSC